MPNPRTSYFGVSAVAMPLRDQRMKLIASNLANADSVVGPDGKPYRAKQVVFEAAPLQGGAAQGVRVKQVVEDAAPGRMVYDPRNPAADDKGYVMMSNVSAVDEMVNMISASRSYQTNVEVMNTAKQLLLRTLTLGQ